MGIEDMKEKASDAGIQKADAAAEQKSGGKGSDQIETAEQAADSKTSQ